MKQLFTSESVSVGHPDKVADQISDAVLDHCLLHDPESRVACETLCTTNRVVLAGEITTHADLSYQTLCGIVRGVVKDIGYRQDTFSPGTITVESLIHRQSPDIAMGVDLDANSEQGAGDQGMMFGYAEGTEATEYMPISIYYAHRVMDAFRTLRESDEFGQRWLQPDAKCQLTFDFEPETPQLEAVVLSHQHNDGIDMEEFRAFCQKHLKEVIPQQHWREDTTIHLNPTGRFVIGGPDGDTGLTGRKIVVDTYGGVGAVGGGAFSGKDPSKVDRSGAYMARYVAKQLVANRMCKRCSIQVAYAIGEAKPVSIYVDDYGEGIYGLEDYVKSRFDFRPRAINELLGLKSPAPAGWGYRQTAQNGHFGHREFPWEKVHMM